MGNNGLVQVWIGHHISDQDHEGVLEDQNGNILNGAWEKTGEGQYENALTGVEGTLSNGEFTIDFGGGNTAIIHDFEEGRFRINFVEKEGEVVEPVINGIGSSVLVA